MGKEQKFYKCEKCGNMVELIKNGGGELVCCGEPKRELVANTTDAATEKHVPFIEKKDGKLIIRIGEVTHPMEEKHYIEWIAVVTGSGTQRFTLKPGDEPVVTVCCAEESGTVYEYCNIHGLWKAEF